MCELLGMSFNLPVTPNISFRGFRHRGENNPDGWGLGWYPDKSSQVVKEPIEAGRSALSEFLKGYSEAKSKIFIAHVRHATIGSKSRKNTHPFYRELSGKEYVFAHHGTLDNHRSIALGRFWPIGDTDSESAFCHLLKCIEEKGVGCWPNEHFRWLESKLQEINSYGTFNCILSDGKFLFCYCDRDGHNGLCFVHRKPPYRKIRLLDEDWEIDLAEEKDPNQSGFIVATNKLTDESWTTFHRRELIVFKDGQIIYPQSPIGQRI